MTRAWPLVLLLSACAASDPPLGPAGPTPVVAPASVPPTPSDAAPRTASAMPTASPSPPAGAARPIAAPDTPPPTLLTSPDVEPLRLDRSTSATSRSVPLTFGPVISALGFEATPTGPAPLAPLLAIEERWICSPAGAGTTSDCGVVAVTPRDPS